jgi:hypothetical protein
MAIIAQNFLPMSGSEKGKVYPLTQPGGFYDPSSGGLGEGAVSALSELFDLYGEDGVSDADEERAKLYIRANELNEIVKTHPVGAGKFPLSKEQALAQNELFDIQAVLKNQDPALAKWITPLPSWNSPSNIPRYYNSTFEPASELTGTSERREPDNTPKAKSWLSKLNPFD